MKTKGKRMGLATLAIGLSFATLAACTGGSGGEAPKGNETETPAGTAPAGEAAASAGGETLPVRWVLPGTAPEDQKMVEQAINEKLKADGLNLAYEAIYVPWDVWDQRTNLMMSTGEEFEMIHIMHDLKGPNILAANGGIIPIDDLLEQYGSRLKQAMPEWIWDAAKMNGETYFVPDFWLDTAYAEGMVTMRKDLLEKNGIAPPRSTAELMAAAEKLKANWPEDNKNVYIYVLNNETPAYLHATYETYPFIVFQDLVYVDQQGNVKPWIETEEFKADAAFFREAYRKGLVNPDVLTVPKEVMDRDQADGRYLYREGEGLSSLENLKKTVPDAETEIYYLTDKPKLRSYGLRNSNGISATSPHPEAAIQFFDWMYGEQENFDLVMYGIPDVHWKDLGPNQIERLKKTEQGGPAYELPYWMAGNVALGRWTPDTHPSVLATKSVVAEDAVNSVTVGFNFDATKVGVEYANALSELKTSIYPIKLGLVDYDAAFPDALKRMNAAGLQAVVAEYERQFKEWQASNP